MDNQNSESRQTVFEELKQYRLEQKITLEEISEHSRIQMRYLEAIETGDLDALPAVYDQLFFKTYLEYIEPPDAERYWEAFRAVRKERDPQHTTTVRRIQSVKAEQSKSKLVKTLYLVVPLLIVLIIILVLAMSSKTVTTKAVDDVPEVTVNEIVKEMQPKPAPVPPPKADSLFVEVKVNALQRTWFRTIKDYADTTEYLLKMDEALKLNADSVLLFLVGNAAGLQFEINGKPAGVLGKANQVITFLKVTPKGIVSKRLKQIKPKEVPNDSLKTN